MFGLGLKGLAEALPEVIMPMCFGLTFLIGLTTGYVYFSNSAEIEQLKKDKAVLELSVKLYQVDAERASKDRLLIQNLNSKIKSLRDELSDESRVCFAGPDAGRVRDLFEPQAAPAPR